ncbi:MAG TPA: tetratricopeptide repeat protein [Humisphaera sp.]|nr:tetratricopeptide repeat protein [Humisphaera sp.]
MQPDISIITPWLDHPEFIDDYEKATRAPGVEVIVIDNGSATDNAAALRQMIDRLGGKYIRNETNRWFSSANNQGLAIAGGKVVLFLNNDIAADAGWLDDVRQVPPGGLFGAEAGKVQLEQATIGFLGGWCIAARIEVWRLLGGWDEQLFKMPYWEDADLSIRAAQAGVKLTQLNWRVVHKKNGTSGFVPGIMYGFEHNRHKLAARLRGQTVPQTYAGPGLESLDRFLQSGRLPEAEAAYQRAVQQQPTNALLWQTYGTTLRMCGRFQPAIDAQRRAIQLNASAEPESLREIAMNFQYMQEFTKSAEAFVRLVQLRPDSADAQTNLATTLNLCGRFVEAADAAGAAIRLAPNDPAGHVQLSAALLRLGRAQEARTAAERAVAADPQQSSGLHALGAALRSLGLLEDALRAYDKANALDPHSWAIHSEREELRKQMKPEKPASG